MPKAPAPTFRSLSLALSMLLPPLLPAPLCAAAPAQVAAKEIQRVVVDASGHHLQLEDGRPFLWLGDTAWFVMHRATRDEASYYLQIRAAQGFNVIQVMLLPECNSLRTPSVWGELPFEEQDPLRPREAYFKRVDDFIEEAATRGLQVALVAAWGDKVTAPWGDGPRIFTTQDPERARRFGQWLGERYGKYNNVMWFMGGDRPPVIEDVPDNWCRLNATQAGFPPNQDWTPVWRAMAEGLLTGSKGRALISYHPQGGEASTSRYLHQEPWLHLNSMQSGHGAGHDQPVWDWVARDYALTPAKPTFDSEPNYEDHPYNPWPKWNPSYGYFRDHDVRKQCWRSVLAGACGVTYGHHAVWQWANSRDEVINHADRDWRDAMNRPAATQMRHLRALLESRPFFRRVPAPALVTQMQDNWASKIVASMDSQGSYAFAYVPNTDQSFTVSFSALKAETLSAWWYDPRNGIARPIGKFKTAATPTHTFRTPPYGPDWVLVLDDDKAGYAAPGLLPPNGQP